MRKGQGFLSACCLSSFPCQCLPLCWQHSSFTGALPTSVFSFNLAQICLQKQLPRSPWSLIYSMRQQVVHVRIAQVFNTSTLLNWIWSMDFDWFMALQFIVAEVRPRVLIFFQKHTTYSLYKEAKPVIINKTTFSTLDFSSSLLFSKSVSSSSLQLSKIPVPCL